MHLCIKCGETKDESRFYVHSKGKLRNQCRSCFNRKSGGNDRGISPERLMILKEAHKAGTLEALLLQRWFG